MLNVGIAGIGFMGWIHYLAYKKVRGTRLAAIATRDGKKQAGDWRGIRGNFGPPGEVVDLGGAAVYSDWEEMLADPRVDLVDVCLPPDLHAAAALRALAAGKHVFCEKPMALTAAECGRMVAAAQKAKRQLLIGHVLPFVPEYDFACKTIASGKYGRLLGGHFKRVISDPLWLKGFYDPRRIGGPLVDLHVHDAHFIRLVCGMPAEVSTIGRMRGEVVEYAASQFRFADRSLVVSAESGVIRQQGRAFTHAYEIHLERATLLYDFAVIGGQPKTLMPCTVLTDQGKVLTPSLGSGDPVAAFEAEIKEVAASVKRGKQSPILGGELARDAIILCHKQTESVKRGKPVRV
jgi:predicted dehydrogenase